MADGGENVQLAAELKTKVADRVLDIQRQELAQARTEQAHVETILQDLTKTLSEVHLAGSERSTKERLSAANPPAMSLNQRLEGMLDAKERAVNNAHLQRQQLLQELSSLKASLVDVKQSDPNSSQEKLKEALQLIADLRYNLDKTVHENSAMQAQQSQLQQALDKRQTNYQTKSAEVEAEAVRERFRVEREKGMRMPTSKMFHVSKHNSKWLGML